MDVMDKLLEPCIEFDNQWILSQTRSFDHIGSTNIYQIDRLIFEQLTQQIKQGEYCDGVVVVDKQEISVHKNVTAAASPVLDQMYKDQEDEVRFHMERGTARGFNCFIDFVYSKQKPDKMYAIEALQMASILKCEIFKKICEEVMKSNIDRKTCLIYLKMAQENTAKDLEDSCIKVLSKQLLSVSQTDAFISLPFESMKQILTRPEISESCSSTDISRAFKLWMKNNTTDAGSLVDLMKQIDLLNNESFKGICMEMFWEYFLSVTKTDAFISLSLESLCQILAHPEISKFCSSFEVLRACKQWLTKNPVATDSVMNLIQQIDLSKIHLEQLHAVLEWEIFKKSMECRMIVLEMIAEKSKERQSLIILGLSHQSNSICKLFDVVRHTELSETIQLPSGSTIPSSAQSLVHDYKLYVIGGEGSNQMIRFDFQTRKWRVLARLKNPGYYRALFGFDNCIFTVGGYINGTYSAAVERYEIIEDRWVSLNPGPVKAHGQAGCVVDGKAYISGGYSGGSSYRNDIHEYNKEDASWIKKSNMVKDRWGHAMFGFNHKMYIVGYDGRTTAASVECYDPQTDQSVVVYSSLPYGSYFNYKATQVLNSSIYCMNNDNTKLICYNIQTNTFTEIPLSNLKSKHVYDICSVVQF